MLLNTLYKLKVKDEFASQSWPTAIEALIQLLAPFAPHIAEELWEVSGHEDSVHLSQWPKWDDKYLISDTARIVVQVNGKVRAELVVGVDSTEEDVVKAARDDQKIKAYLEGKEIKRVILVPNKLLNLVVG